MTQGKRILFLGLGHFCVALGLVGAFLPLLPTTPFLLVATWAYGHASPRLRHWLWTHPRFGASIRAWHEHGVIGRKTKALSLSAMTLSCMVTWFVTDNPLAAIGQAVVLVCVGAFIVSRPEAPPRPTALSDPQ
ncbi:MAG: YbaN family protein [Rhodospirillum sp.]|nr:YbaN family protein [Rhodospirillum sp.]MCF8491606.1 YbaN family protein [Rhodospirillum sp.]